MSVIEFIYRRILLTCIFIYSGTEFIRDIEFLENCDASDDIQERLENVANDLALENVANDLAKEFLEDYSNDVEALLTDSNLAKELLEDYYNNVEALLTDSNEPGACLHLEIEVLDEITWEFLDDVSTEMVIDKITTRRSTSQENGLG